MELTRADSVNSADAERHILDSHVGIYPNLIDSDNVRGSFGVAPGLTYPSLKSTWKDRIADWLIGAAILMIILVGSMFVVLQFPVPLRETPIVYHGIHLPEYKEYCPGDSYEYSTDIEITGPAIFSRHVAIMEAETHKYISSTITQMPSIPRPWPVRLDQPVSFSIPDLPPGDYIRVMGIDADHVDSIPVFVEVPFTISTDCN